MLKKDADGTLEAFELSDLIKSEIGELRNYEAQLAMLLSEDDVIAVAEAIEPGSSAAVLVWENVMGGTVRLCGSPFRWSTGGQWSDPDPGLARSDRSGRRRRIRR